MFNSLAPVYSMYMADNLESNHGSGCVVTFCDSHTIFLRSDISPITYEQLCNPNELEHSPERPGGGLWYHNKPRVRLSAIGREQLRTLV